MITQIYGVPIFVRDQEKAIGFYRDVLGFTVSMDVDMGTFRWLTVCPKDKPDTQFILGLAPEGDENFANTSGIVLYCADIQAAYDHFVSQGVQFEQPPVLMPFGEY